MSAVNTAGLTASELRYWLSYDLESGLFRWVRSASNRAPVGFTPTCTDSKGYVVIRVNNHMHRAHRLAWLYMTGEWPAEHIDHVNRVKNDNRWANLRLATLSENGANAVFPKGVSGLKGVIWDKQKERWLARIKVNQKSVHLGYFYDKYAAHEVYKKAAATAFGNYARSE